MHNPTVGFKEPEVKNGSTKFQLHWRRNHHLINPGIEVMQTLIHHIFSSLSLLLYLSFLSAQNTKQSLNKSSPKPAYNDFLWMKKILLDLNQQMFIEKTKSHSSFQVYHESCTIPRIKDLVQYPNRHINQGCLSRKDD